MAGKTRGRLRITAGAGEGHEIDAEVASRYSGRPVRDALMGIIQDEVRDPELRQMLTEPRLALELYGGQDDAGELQEVPLSPTEQWDRVLKELENADIEVGIARSHAGGARGSGVQSHSRSLQKCFPRQRVIAHVAGSEPTDAERDDVRMGTAVFLTGSALAKAEYICRELGGKEALWYYAADSDDPFVVREVIIPEQTGSGAHCQADGSDVLRAARKAKGRRLRIIGAGHSHGWMGVFSSTTDWREMLELAMERVANTTLVRKVIEGRVAVSDASEQVLEVRFADNPDTTVRITGGRSGSQNRWPDGRAVQMEQTYRRSVSWFSTHNHRGKHLFPMLEVTSCPHCGSRQERQIDPSDVVVHVIGPVSLDEKARDALREEIREEVKASTWDQEGSAGTLGDDSSYATCHVEATGDSLGGRDEADSQLNGGPASFEVYRHGMLVATVAAATMERAASETPSLAEALRWTSTGGNASEQDVGHG